MRIGITGYAKAGKDEVANVFVEQFGFVRVNMSDALDRYLQILNPWIYVSIDDACDITEHLGYDAPVGWGVWYKYRELCELLDYVTRKKIKEVREFLQCLGTDVGRAIDPMLWVDEANKEARKHEHVVTTGIRFTEELDGIDWLIHVDRPGVGPVNDHSSENLDHLFEQAHVKIENSKTLDDLRAATFMVSKMFGLVSP